MNAVQITAMGNKPINMGKICGSELIVKYELAASVTLTKGYGKMMYLSTNRAALGNAADELLGWALYDETKTFSSTAGADKLEINIALDAVYEMPIYTGAKTKANLLAFTGDTCDVIISTYQYADVDSSTTDNVLQIVGWNYYGSAAGQQTLLVRLTPKEIGQTASV